MNENGNVYANSKYKIFNDLGLGEVRTYVDEQGAVWFFMNDIARILEVDNPRNITAKLRRMGLGGCVQILDTSTLSSNQYVDSFERKIKETIISESALLFICGNSRKPNALKLFKFVSENVVPSLARHGGYIMPEDREMYNNNPDLIKDLTENNKRLEDQLQVGYKYAKEQEDEYFELVQDYNSLIDKYNALLQEFNSLSEENEEPMEELEE